MIIVSKKDKPFVYSTKGTPRRKAIIANYEAEIEELYRTVEDTAITGFGSPSIWSPESSRAYARTVVLGVMMTTLGDDDDLFAHGCDRFDRYLASPLSLTLTWALLVFRRPGSGRSSSTACAHAPRSTLGISLLRSYTNILLSMR